MGRERKNDNGLYSKKGDHLTIHACTCNAVALLYSPLSVSPSVVSRSVATLLVPVVEVVGRSGDSTIGELEISNRLVLDGAGLTAVAGI